MFSRKKKSLFHNGDNLQVCKKNTMRAFEIPSMKGFFLLSKK